jgi:hypothetical protein
LALALALLAASLLASPLGGLIISVVCGVCALFLRARYRSDLLAARVGVPPHRERLDRIVDGDMQAVLSVGLTSAGVMTGFGVRPVDVGLAQATPLLVAAAASAVYLSSLVDWFVILPRISGMLGARPCRPEREHHPRFPHTWRDTTRWWLIHRIVAALGLRFGLAYALTLTVHRYVSMPGGTKIVAGALLGFLASYLKAVPSAAMQAGHPTMIVGDTLRRFEVSRVPRRIRVLRSSIALPVKKRVESGIVSPREWVYDIALEGVQVVVASERERAGPRLADGSIDYENRPRKIRLQDINRCQPADAFHGCEGRCSGINWYCIENLRCFESK